MNISKELFRIAKAISDTGIKTASSNARSVLIDMAENGGLDWKSIANECIQQMSEDQLKDVCDALDIYYLDSSASESLLSTAEAAHLWETIGRECLEQMSVDEAASVCEALDIDTEDEDEKTLEDINGRRIRIGDQVMPSNLAFESNFPGWNGEHFNQPVYEVMEIHAYEGYVEIKNQATNQIGLPDGFECQIVSK